jgi:hypothetical protein
MPSSYKGFTTISIPVTVPTSIEVQNNAIVAQSRNPFTGQTQQFSWNVQYKEISVSLPPMVSSDAQPWLGFFDTLNGTQNVFSFPAPVVLQFPYELSVATGFTASATSSTITLSSYGTSTVNDAYKNDVIEIAQGTGTGQAVTITGYVGSTHTATVTPSFTTTPDTTSVFTVPRFFRLKTPNAKWSIKSPGALYYITFECTEVIA